MTLLLIISYIITTIIISPYLYYFFTDKNNTLIDKQRLHYNNDLLSFFVPLPIQLLGGKFFNGLTNKFLTSNMFEKNAYLGFPLIIIIILFCKEFWRKNNTRFLFYTMIITALLSLGSMLQLAGYKIFLFPWYNFYSMPILYHLLPCRLIMYTTLIISIMIAIWLKKSKMKSLWKYTLLFCAIVFLLPNTMSKQTPSFTKTPLPVFMQKNNYKKLIPKNAIVLFLPQYPMGNAYDELLWQLQSDMYFKLAQGNIGGIPEYFFSNKFLQPFYAPKLGTTCPQETILPTNAYKQLKEFIDNNNINTIIIKDKSLNKQYKQILAKLNLIPVKMGNFLIYQT
jgi:hypothetical protein